MSRRTGPARLVPGLLVSCVLACTPAEEAKEQPPVTLGSDALWNAATPADTLIRPREYHFAGLRQITFGGENAEAYWSPDGSKLVLQSTRPGVPCDQIFLVTAENLSEGGRMVSSGQGRTTCAYFLDAKRILYASTHLSSAECPPPPDRSQGYVWAVYPEYEIVVHGLEGGDPVRLTDTPGYDAEATLSPDGTTVVFTSVRDGDLEIYTMHADGSDVRRLTHEPGYDGGPFFSPDGEWICFRSRHPTDAGERADYQDLLQRGLVRPGSMDIWVMRKDGSEKRQVTQLPGASFAPFFTPSGEKIIFSSNCEDERGRNFDLYLVTPDGAELEKITTDPSFDGFPMFSPDGKYLAFSSNRGAREQGETNVFLARWKAGVGP